MIRRCALLAYVGVVGLLIACYFALPGLRMYTLSGVGLVTVVAIGVRLAYERPPRWQGWALIGVALALLNAGNVAFIEEAAVAVYRTEYPRASGALFLLAYFPLAVGLLWLGQPRLPWRSAPMLLDTAVLSLAGSLIVWIALVRPALEAVRLSTVGTLMVIGSWVGYVAVLAAAIRVVLTWRRNASLGLLAVGVALFLGGVLARGAEILDGIYRTGTFADVIFVTFIGLCGVAALIPSADLVATARFARPAVPGPSRLTLLAVAMLVAPTALLAQVASGTVSAGASIALVMAVISVVVVLRLSLSAAANRRRARADHALRTAARSLLLATSEDEVLAIVRRTVPRVLPGAGTADVRMARWHDERARDREPVLAPLDGSRAATRDRVGELLIPMSIEDESPHGQGTGASTSHVVRVTAPILALVESMSVLRAMADQAALASHRIALTGRLEAEERERYFRTLVLTSDEVTLIVRGGSVVYATPSAQAMFGRDIAGEKMLDLIKEPANHAGTVATPAVVAEGTTTVEAVVRRGDDVAVVLVRTRDLTDDPTVRGTVATLRDVTAEWRLRNELAHRASHDPLTGLANARLFRDELMAAAGRAGEAGIAVLYLDLDNFKAVNDAHGHDTGDRLLIEVARRIRLSLGEADLAARVGGDEFAVLLPRVADVECVGQIAARIADALSRAVAVDELSVVCPASIGVAFAGEPADPAALTSEADAALYAAKAAGKGHWRVYGDDMPIPARRRGL